MGKVQPEITPRLREFIAAQHVFFVATAPEGSDGHVNVSPKGVAGTSLLVDAHTFAYLDITASGVETIAHLRQNGRITVMFCSFGPKPNIVRLYGKGRVLTAEQEEFAEWVDHFPAGRAPGMRAVIVVDVDRVSDSCGFGVPMLEYVGEREIFPGHNERKSIEAIRTYQRERNAVSIDGLPAMAAEDGR